MKEDFEKKTNNENKENKEGKKILVDRKKSEPNCDLDEIFKEKIKDKFEKKYTNRSYDKYIIFFIFIILM